MATDRLSASGKRFDLLEVILTNPISYEITVVYRCDHPHYRMVAGRLLFQRRRFDSRTACPCAHFFTAWHHPPRIDLPVHQPMADGRVLSIVPCAILLS